MHTGNTASCDGNESLMGVAADSILPMMLLRESVFNKLEETIERFTHLPVVRDGDPELTLHEKVIYALLGCGAVCHRGPNER